MDLVGAASKPLAGSDDQTRLLIETIRALRLELACVDCR